MKKVIISAIIATLLIPTTAFGDFNDVNSSTNYKSSIEWMANNGVIDGYPNGSFQPDKCVNRAEMLKLSLLAANIDLIYERRDVNPFSDVYTDQWYFPYINTANTYAFINGYSDETFRPNNCVNRVEAMKIAMRVFDINEEPLPGMGWSYADVSPNEWYTGFFYVSIRDNLVGRLHEYSNISIDSPASRFFYPAEGMTRKEVAEMLYRMKATKDNQTSVYNTSLTPNPISQTNILSYNGPAQFKLDFTSIPCNEYAYDHATCDNDPNANVEISNFYLILNSSYVSNTLNNYLNGNTINVGCVDSLSMYGDLYTYDKNQINLYFYESKTANINFEVDTNQGARGDTACLSQITKVNSIE